MRRLLIRSGGIGDCITCLPVMEWLRADYTEVWVPTAVAPLIQFADQVRSIAGTGIELAGLAVQLPVSLVETLTAFDEIVTWYGSNRPEFREAMARCHPRCRFLPALPPADSHQPVTDFHAVQVGAPLELHPRLRVEPVESRPTLVIHPFSGGRTKNWPLARFRELAQASPLAVEWTAGPEEELPEIRRFDNLLDLLAGCVARPSTSVTIPASRTWPPQPAFLRLACTANTAPPHGALEANGSAPRFEPRSKKSV